MSVMDTVVAAQDDNGPTFCHESDRKRYKLRVGETRVALDPSHIFWKCSAVDQQTHTMRS